MILSGIFWLTIIGGTLLLSDEMKHRLGCWAIRVQARIKKLLRDMDE
jgi:hypothetical protein